MRQLNLIYASSRLAPSQWAVMTTFRMKHQRIKSNGNTPLIFIIHKTGNLKMSKRLLEKGAAVNTQNHTGETALMYAAWRGHTHIVHLLLENRADASLKNRQDDTALTLAESKGHLEIVEMLKVVMK